MSEIDRRIDATVEAALEVRAGYSPFLSRYLHTPSRDLEADAHADAEEDRFTRARNRGCVCTCYPRAFVSEGRAVQEQLKAEHIAAGVHRPSCPMFVHRRDYEPWFMGLRHDIDPPSYTEGQARRDAEAEALE